MSIRLAPLTRENWCECSRLEVKPEQRAFVPSNLLCIAEAQFYPAGAPTQFTTKIRWLAS